MSVKVLSIDDDGVTSLACAGEMNGLAMSSRGGGLKEVLGDNWAGRRVALDLSAASYLDSAAIGWLLSLHKAFDEAGGKLVLHGISPNLRRVIDIMRIHQVLHLAEDHGQAIKQARGAK